MRRLNKKFVFIAVLLILLCLSSTTWSRPFPPGQPETGPGGRDYIHGSMRSSYYSNGTKPHAFWIFEPMNPEPAMAPVVVFLHGWLAMDPSIYNGWIRHLVLRGNVVIYPVYQNVLTLPGSTPNHALTGIKAALAELKKPGHVSTDPALFAMVGHSLGGYLCAILADRAISEGLPGPKVVMPIEPGVEFAQIPEDLSGIPDTALTVVVEGEEDDVVDPTTARTIWGGVQHLPEENRDFIQYRTDRHGNPALVADHLFPTSNKRLPRSMNALEFFGIWKIFDALLNAAFYGRDREFALGNTPEQRWMGEWSDGVPVLEPWVTHHP